MDTGTNGAAQSAPKRGNWRWEWLLGCHIAAVLLLASWLWAPTRALWDIADDAVFFALNGSLGKADWWLWIWGIQNTRYWDTASGIILGVVMLVYLFSSRKYIRERLAVFTFIGFYILGTAVLTREVVFEFFIDIRRLSPSLVLEPVVWLREHMPEWRPKQDSHSSFPGDHATVSFILTAIVWHQTNWRYGLVMALLGVWFSLPRLFGGAHWLTDLLVGGGVIALVWVPWAVATPFTRLMRLYLLKVINLLYRRVWRKIWA